MATNVTLNGTSYSIPATAEDNWGDEVSNYLIALGSGVLQKAGGAFTLTAEVDFGANFGLKSAYYKSRGTVASAGIFRLANNETIGWRNNANSADLSLKVNTSDLLEYNSNEIADFGTVSKTEFGYLSGVTSAIQTQIDSKNDAPAEGAFVDGDKTKLDGIEAGADVTDATNVNAAGATMNTDSTLVGNSYFLDEDNMTSNDATKVPSQQSVKAYVDTQDATKQNDVITTRGDIVYGNASGAAARLGLGTSGQVLGSDGTDVVWTTAAAGDVIGPATSADNTIARFNGTNNKTIQASSITIDDSDNIDNVTSLDLASDLKLNSDDTITGCASITLDGGSTALDHYEEVTHSSTWTYSTSGTSVSKDIRFCRNGNIVVMTVEASNIFTPGSAASSVSIDTAFPSNFRPSTNFTAIIRAQNNSNRTIGLLTVTTTGNLSIVPDATNASATFTGSSGYPDGFSVSWVV